jgi:chromosome condensin MukBEF complex kleisin-like MukF subunit
VPLALKRYGAHTEWVGDAGAQDLSISVYQAQGVVSEQSQCGLDCALFRMRLRARRDGRDLEDVARTIVDQQVRIGVQRPGG